jgi:hypothetical protein
MTAWQPFSVIHPEKNDLQSLCQIQKLLEGNRNEHRKSNFFSMKRWFLVTPLAGVPSSASGRGWSDSLHSGEGVGRIAPPPDLSGANWLTPVGGRTESPLRREAWDAARRGLGLAWFARGLTAGRLSLLQAQRRHGERAGQNGQAKIGSITWPWTSVRRRSMPLL